MEHYFLDWLCISVWKIGQLEYFAFWGSVVIIHWNCMLECLYQLLPCHLKGIFVLKYPYAAFHHHISLGFTFDCIYDTTKMTNHRVLARLHARMNTETHTRHKVHVRFASNTNIDGKHFRRAWSSGNKIPDFLFSFSKKCITSQGLVYLSFSSGNCIYTPGADFPCKLFSDSDSVWRELLGFESIIVVYLCVFSPDAVARNHYDQLCEWNGGAPHSTPGWYLLHTKDCCLGLSVLNPPMSLMRFLSLHIPVILSCLFCVLQGWWQVCSALPQELSKKHLP